MSIQHLRERNCESVDGVPDEVTFVAGLYGLRWYESIATDWQMAKLTELMNLDFRRVNWHGNLLMVV